MGKRDGLRRATFFSSFSCPVLKKKSIVRFLCEIQACSCPPCHNSEERNRASDLFESAPFPQVGNMFRNHQRTEADDILAIFVLEFD